MSAMGLGASQVTSIRLPLRTDVIWNFVKASNVDSIRPAFVDEVLVNKILDGVMASNCSNNYLLGQIK